MSTSKRVTIFEGPDGGGKTTAAKIYAEATGARYVHLGSFPRVNRGLPRLYVEAMLPAILGYQDVVLDRCWISEFPYGSVFRSGHLRVGAAGCRMLERLALRCDARVVVCLPPIDAVVNSFRARRGKEMLNDEAELLRVYHLYHTQLTRLPTKFFDYTTDKVLSLLLWQNHSKRHPLELQTAGNWTAPWVLVGEEFALHKDLDPLYQWPFASFSSEGCSEWLTDQLELGRIWEPDLLWVNANQDLSFLHKLEPRGIVALGNVATSALRDAKLEAMTVEHPQCSKRFHPSEIYELIKLLQEPIP